MSGNKNMYGKKANLGCGEDYREGWHNVDIRQSTNPDEVVNLDKTPWPWPDGVFERVLIDNVIEHLDDRLTTLKELHRITEPGGTVTVRFPHWNSPGHYTNPTHTKTITHRTFSNHLVSNQFKITSIDCTRVRFGRALPKNTALWLADHVGHLVSEVEVTVEVIKDE